MSLDIKVIIGLGNPGYQYILTRHNIGFRVVDALAQKYLGVWNVQHNFEKAQISINKPILLVKPQTYMNDSGKVIPSLKKQGIQSEQILVVHDELEKPFGTVSIKQGGSARGHNGLRSIMQFIDPNFYRLRIGIGRPEHKEQVSRYVLENFSESQKDVDACIDKSVSCIEKFILGIE